MDAQAEWAWDRGQYDEVGRRLVELADQLVAVIEQRAGVLASRPVVDLACGTGNVALAAAARGAAVTGVDLGTSLLAIARARSAATGVEAAWLLADATDTRLPPASFDVALSSVGLIFVPDRPRAIAEVVRLLGPGGHFGYTAWVKDMSSPFFKPFESFLPEDDGEGPQSWQWAEPDVVRPLLAADFDDVRIEPREHVWSFDSVEDAVGMIEASPMHVGALEQVRTDDHPALRRAFAAAFSRLIGSNGRVSYASPYVVVTAQLAR